MIASVHGTVLSVRLDAAVVEVGGVGLLLQATPATLAGLRVGQPGRLLLVTQRDPQPDRQGTGAVPVARTDADGDGPALVLGPEWVPGPDGVLSRDAARVILLDEDDRVLLVRGHDVDAPGRSWWFTVGGGIDTGEDARSAAVREVCEETGIRIDPAELVGPVYTRSALFDFAARTCRQHEELFLARVRSGDLALSRDGWTDVERDVIDELRWWDLDELARVQIEVFPADLAELVRAVLVWDGTTRHLGLARE